MRSALIVLILGTSAPSASAQQAVPSDNELHAAYCEPVVKFMIDLERQSIARLEAQKDSPINEPQTAVKDLPEIREQLSKLEAVLDRLQRYLRPKMPALDPIALAAAEHRGEADVQELKGLSGERWMRCIKKCISAPDISACIASCVDPTLLGRMKACRDPTWLPF